MVNSVDSVDQKLTTSLISIFQIQSTSWFKQSIIIKEPLT